MSDPTIAVQRAIMDRLADLVPDLGGSVFDHVPGNPAGAYATVSVPTVVPMDEECWDRTELTVQIDFWSCDPDSGIVKAMAALARTGLHEVDNLLVPGFAIDRIRVDGTFYSREAQTLINRARMMLAIEAQPI